MVGPDFGQGQLFLFTKKSIKALNHAFTLFFNQM